MSGRGVSGGRGVAAAALGAIVLVTVAWWTLALYPVSPEAPDWILRTRAVCFGTRDTGLPNAGGWILLIGEPLGMAAVLLVVWRQAMAADLAWLAGSWRGRALIALGALVVVAGSAAAVRRVWMASQSTGLATEAGSAGSDPPSARLNGKSMSLSLVDQTGASFELRQLRGRRVIVTFAFGHCETVCPTLVRDVLAMRGAVGADSTPLIVVTVDPWRDVPARLAFLASAWGLKGEDRYLSGSVSDVLATLQEWGIGVQRNERTGDVSHPGVVMLLDEEGRLAARLDGNWRDLSRVLADG